MNEQLTSDELAELFEKGEDTSPDEGFAVDSQHGKVTPIGCAVTISLRNGGKIEAKPFAAAYTNLGIYVKGDLDDAEKPGYYIAPYAAIDLLDFDLENVEEQIAKAAAELAQRVENAQEQDDDGDEPAA